MLLPSNQVGFRPTILPGVRCAAICVASSNIICALIGFFPVPPDKDASTWRVLHAFASRCRQVMQPPTVKSIKPMGLSQDWRAKKVVGRWCPSKSHVSRKFCIFSNPHDTIFASEGNIHGGPMDPALALALALALGRYTREVSDPAHRQEYLDYLAQIEAAL